MTEHIIAVSKKIGLSFDEINELTTQELMDIIHAYADSDGKKEKGGKKAYRWATPEELSKFEG